MKTEGGLFEEGQSPEINRGVFSTPYAVGVAVLQEGGEVQERSACDMMRLGLKEGERKKRRDELLMAQQVWSPLGNTGARGEGHRYSAEDKGWRVCLYSYLCVCENVCVCPCPPCSYSTTHNGIPLSPMQSMSHLPIYVTARNHSLHTRTN